MEELSEKQKKALANLKALGRPAGSEEVRITDGHISVTRNALLGLVRHKLVRRTGTGRGTRYELREASSKPAAAPKTPRGRAGFGVSAPNGVNGHSKKRWVLIIDGEALVVDASSVQVYPEREAVKS